MIAILLLLPSINISCKAQIQTFPVDNTEVPLRQLENGNHEVSQGFVIFHAQMIIYIKVMSAKIEKYEKKLGIR